MSLFGLFQISGSALAAERLRAEVATSNLANAETTSTPGGGPYRRRMVVFNSQPAAPFRMVLASSLGAAQPQGGVRVGGVVEDSTAPLRRYEPGHPDADGQGYVSYPNISPVQETVDLMGAERAYELNASAVQAAKQMIQQSLQILK